ncbi:MAG TPA: pyridoxamine 5'-phosphate oxidase family protein [Blastocatellia bacterium]|nr:pyridoxamine 5'-phosphate oxidase family protein [Blastocatellia bacterium]
MSNSDHTASVRMLMNAERQGVLCTLSRKFDGWPFGSVTPYALSASGEPIILVSDLAEHTRNVRADPRVSLFIQDSAATNDPQAGARLTLMGLAVPVAEGELDEAQQRYLERFPEARQNFQLGDFTLFKIELRQARFIGGFGQMFWLPREEFTLQR